MAEVRLNPSLPAVNPAASARTTDAVRAAQRAFFDTALHASQTTAATRPIAKTASVETAGSVAHPAAQAPQDRAAAPARGLRPGSLIDIRV